MESGQRAWPPTTLPRFGVFLPSKPSRHHEVQDCKPFLAEIHDHLFSQAACFMEGSARKFFGVGHSRPKEERVHDLKLPEFCATG